MGVGKEMEEGEGVGSFLLISCRFSLRIIGNYIISTKVQLPLFIQHLSSVCLYPEAAFLPYYEVFYHFSFIVLYFLKGQKYGVLLKNFSNAEIHMGESYSLIDILKNSHLVIFILQKIY